MADIDMAEVKAAGLAAFAEEMTGLQSDDTDEPELEDPEVDELEDETEETPEVEGEEIATEDTPADSADDATEARKTIDTYVEQLGGANASASFLAKLTAEVVAAGGIEAFQAKIEAAQTARDQATRDEQHKTTQAQRDEKAKTEAIQGIHSMVQSLGVDPINDPDYYNQEFARIHAEQYERLFRLEKRELDFAAREQEETQASHIRGLNDAKTSALTEYSYAMPAILDQVVQNPGNKPDDVKAYAKATHDFVSGIVSEKDALIADLKQQLVDATAAAELKGQANALKELDVTRKKPQVAGSSENANMEDYDLKNITDPSTFNKIWGKDLARSR